VSKRFLALALMQGLLGLAASLPAADTAAAAESKEALKALQEFIGEWNGVGGPDKPVPSPRDPVWKEKINWGWRFKGDDAWLTFDIKGGKHLRGGEVRYLPAKKKYQLTTIDTEGKKAVFEGDFKNDTLTVERTDPETKERQRITMNTAAEGVRLIVRFGKTRPNSTLFLKDYMVAATREGESLAAREKKTLCVVSGGLGTMPVVYKGETFYVCCSGCRDAFNENPEKYVKEFKAKQGKQ
jgi:hypothetical protein